MQIAKPASTSLVRRAATVAAAAFALSALGLAVCIAQRLPDGPEPVAWDRAACDHCKMHVGDPRFAAQLQTRDGQVRNYDDPGCLLRALPDHRAEVHAIWLRDARADRWLRAEEAGFVPATDTPMGFGLAAVPKDTPGAIDPAAAKRRLMQRSNRSAGVAPVADSSSEAR